MDQTWTDEGCLLFVFNILLHNLVHLNPLHFKSW
jgi:hypothetical protein